MAANVFPNELPNWIAGEETPAASGGWLDNLAPHDARVLCRYARSGAEDVDRAVAAAKAAQPAWADTPPVRRGLILLEIVKLMQARADELAQIVAEESGKSLKDARGEVGGAAQCGLFFASEGQRLYGRTTTSGVANKYNMTIRQPVGVAGLIIAANTPIANVAWKVFPALVCGNAAVLKAAEDTPATAWFFAKLAREAGLPAGVLNVIQGLGQDAGGPLVQHPGVGVISFTGSTRVGQWIAQEAAKRMAKLSLELGGKNALIVCDDADIAKAVHWSALSAFSNAGQRCASGSRIVVFDAVYDRFVAALAEKTRSLKIGIDDGDDLGPVINERQLSNMVAAVEGAKAGGATVLVGGGRLTDEAHRRGFYMAPTLVEGAAAESEISWKELFGPIANLYRVRDFAEALAAANNSPYGLTGCIHTRNYHRAMEFTRKVQTGVAVVNMGTFGSEPHMPFGGLKQSGNGSREPGTEALDIYSDLKDVYLGVDPEAF